MVIILHPSNPLPCHCFGISCTLSVRSPRLIVNAIFWLHWCVTKSLICFNSLKLSALTEPNNRIWSSFCSPHNSAGEFGFTYVTTRNAANAWFDGEAVELDGELSISMLALKLVENQKFMHSNSFRQSNRKCVSKKIPLTFGSANMISASPHVPQQDHFRFESSILWDKFACG